MLVDHYLSRAAERYPDKEAVICEGHRTSFSELDEISNRLSVALIEHGVNPGDRVAVLLDNSIEAVISVFGILKAGAVFVMIGQTVKADKLRFVLKDCSVRALVTQMNPFARLLEAVDGHVESLKTIVLFGDEVPAGETKSKIFPVASDLHYYSSSTTRNGAIDVDLAALIYTSGTTGFPKGVAVSHYNVVSAARSITQYLENTPNDVILNFLPLSFDYGLYQLLMSVMLGSTLVLEKSFAYPYAIVKRVAEERVTGFPGVPTAFAVLLQMTGIDPEMFDSVRYISNTAAALPPVHIKRLGRLFRNARIYSMYGLTECKRVSFLPPDDLEHRPKSVGKGMPNERVFVVDERGHPVPPGTVGELVVQGSNVMQGYWNRPNETAEMIRPGKHPWERLLYTGDLFTVDEDGYLYFVSRKDDIIKSRGEKVSPSEIERVIYELDAVKEVVVIGVPDEILGQALKAIVVPGHSGEITEKQIIVHCGRRLENFMVPKEVEFRDSLPKSQSGKILRRVLRPNAESRENENP